MADLTDEELMRSYQKGDFKAFEVLYGRYSGKVYGYLRKRVRSGADDVHQAVFMKLHEARFQYKDKFKFAPWLFTITRTVMLDHFRKEKRIFRNLNIDDVEVAAPGTLEQVPMGEIEALQDLSDSQKKVLAMRFDQGLEFDTMAQELNTSSANIRQQVSRAVRKLRQLVAKK